MSERKRVLVCDNDPLLVDPVNHRFSSSGDKIAVGRLLGQAQAR